MMKLFSIALCGLFLSGTARAQTVSADPQATPSNDHTYTHVHKTTVKEYDSDHDQDEIKSHRPAKETTITAKFGAKGQAGTAGCKTEDAVNDVIKDLKADCKAWVNDQKADLKSRYLTSTCEESCEDCGTSLRRCSVTGTLHYLVRDENE